MHERISDNMRKTERLSVSVKKKIANYCTIRMLQ